MKYYQLADVKKELEKSIDEAQTLATAWKNVSFKTKKDGKPFARMAQNFVGADYKPWQFATHAYENQVSVWARTKAHGIVSNSFLTYAPTQYMNNNKTTEKPQNILPPSGCIKEIYVFDLDDCKEEINNKIEYWSHRAEELQTQLESAEEIYKKFKAAYDAAFEILHKETAQFSESDLKFALKELVKGTW